VLGDENYISKSTIREGEFRNSIIGTLGNSFFGGTKKN
jgi:hypothetical protein